ncbi:Crp/Fnr family transcriptional regulator [Sphingomonas lutea]|uniref:Crp/Fnr family transcriptional regulator n=1 Tax=Sphingomonas lutea TaxID=1045317 RepID=A0A7G9SIV1_9SPHN|nr:Crp/Fnr family transcriptional regulator [Sphingomonas lutea]QNN67776.1 Crp/Fnr family transcriptional regulator [Sphingomonas lutea]
MDVLADDHATVDDAFLGNRLLSTFTGESRALIETAATMVELDAGALVLRRGEQVTDSLFPIGETMVSLGVALSGNRSIEVASIGREGAVGGIVSCGQAPAFSRAEVLVGGAALKVPMDALEGAKRRSGFVANIFCRYSDYLLSQVMQSVACNAFHSITQRAARWLLHAQDRAGSRLELTQEAMAGLLGVQRTTVNAVIRELQDDGLITTRRGIIHVIDRAGLEARACECYDAIERHFADVIGDTGHGGI